MATTGLEGAGTADEESTDSNPNRGSDNVQLFTGGLATTAPPAPVATPRSLMSQRVFLGANVEPLVGGELHAASLELAV